jgi:hypothetical protein
MCTVLLPPADNPIAINKYIISYIYTEHDESSVPSHTFSPP